MKKIILIGLVVFSLSPQFINAAELKIFKDKDGNTLLTNAVGENGKPTGITDEGVDLSTYDNLVKTIKYDDTKVSNAPKAKVPNDDRFHEDLETREEFMERMKHYVFSAKKPCVNRAEWNVMGKIEQIESEYIFNLCLLSKAEQGKLSRSELIDYKMMIWKMNHNM